MEINVNKMKIAMVLNYIIVIFTLLGLIFMYYDIKFMYGVEPKLSTSGLGMFRFFTVDSNFLMGICSLLMAHHERKVITGNKENISSKYYVLKLIGTVSISLTFIVVVTYLSRISPGGMSSMIQNSNLFFHLIIPILSIITFCFFEKTNKIKLRYVLLSLIPVLIYGIFYLINVFVHVENDTVSSVYDWYWFLQNGLHNVYIIFPIILCVVYVIGLLLWSKNKK